MKIKSLVLSLLFAAPLYADTTTSADPLKDKMQSLINDYHKKYSEQERFSAVAASVLIPKDKQIDINDIKTVVTGTIGFPPYSQPITANDLFDIGSITKSFTSMIILQLEVEGKLNLSDPVGKWLPQYTNWKDVTIRQLLNMTSGIPNYSEDKEFEKRMMSNLSGGWTDQELISYAHPEKPIKVNKNNLFEYCNTNYILAALIIEAITQDTFEHQLQIRILAEQKYFKNSFYPAGPHGSEVQKAIASKKTHGYFYDEKTQTLYDTFDNNLAWAGAAGAIVANTQDVVSWVQVLYHGLLINPEFREHVLSELESVVSMKTGKPLANVTAEDPSAFGLGVGYHYDQETRQRFWTYQGSTLGYRVMYLWHPCNDVTTVIALNGKGAEGNANSKLGNHIVGATIDLYKAVIALHPELKCDS